MFLKRYLRTRLQLISNLNFDNFQYNEGIRIEIGPFSIGIIDVMLEFNLGLCIFWK